MDDATREQIADAIANGRSVTINGHSVQAHSLSELIKALRYLEDVDAGRNPGELRRATVVLPGVGGCE
jgi:hypothetical protein